MLVSTLLFVDLVKHKRHRDDVTIMPISTSNKRYLKVFGNSMAISRLINFMITIGLISIADSKYRFNSNDNKSRTYHYFYDNECLLKEYCEANNIYASSKSSGNASLFNRLGNGDFDPRKVRFSSKLRLEKPTGHSKTGFQNLLMETLYRKYPHLE